MSKPATLCVTTLVARILSSIHPERMTAIVAPLAADVLAGRVDRDDAVDVLAQGLDAAVDFKTMIPNAFGMQVEAVDGEVFKKAIDWIFDLHLGVLVGVPNGPAANSPKPRNAGEWFQRLFTPRKYAEARANEREYPTEPVTHAANGG